MNKLLWILTFGACATLHAATPQVEAQGAAAVQSGSHSMMLIDPKTRTQDYQQAFEQLRKEKTPTKVFFQLYDGTIINNIIEMTPMTNGNLILFKYNTTQGIKFLTVEVENIQSLGYQ